VSQRLRPSSRDYFVLKPKHSGFFDTTLDTLLDALRIRRVIVTGIAGNICVLFTANDAYMREYRIFAPACGHKRATSTTLTAFIEPFAAAYEQRRQRDQSTLEHMVVYAQTALCRTHVLLEALGETAEWSQCRTCDDCRGLAVRPEARRRGSRMHFVELAAVAVRQCEASEERRRASGIHTFSVATWPAQ